VRADLVKDNLPMKDTSARGRCGLLSSVVLALIAFSGCDRTAAGIPRGLAGTLTQESTIDEIIKSADPNAVVRSGQSGGGGGGGTRSIWGSDIQASYACMYNAMIQTTKELDGIVGALKTGLQSRIKTAGAKHLPGRTGGTRRGRETLHGPLKTLRAMTSIAYKVNGYRGDVFLVAYPIEYPIPDSRNHFEVIVRVVEVLVDK
jgi:hypothetical protein